MILDLSSLETAINAITTTLGTPAGASISVDIADIEAKLDHPTHGLAALNADLDALLADVGDASGSGLGSLYNILGDPAQTFTTMVGYQGATSLANKLTAARAGYLDNINNANLATIADISTLTAVNIAFLNNINNANLATIPDISTLSAARIGYLDELAAANLPTDVQDVYDDTRYIFSTALTAPTVDSLAKFIASGGTILGSTLADSKSLIDALGVDGNDALSHNFSEEGVMQYAHGKHLTTYTLFIIPEAVAAINTHNTTIRTSLEKLGRVLTITQTDALSYPDFNTYTLCVLGTDNGSAWNTANLADIKEISDMPIVCCDSTSAAYLEMGTANANVVGTKVLNGVANIEGSIVGMGLHGHTGLAVGAQDIADVNTTFASLDMSGADITEVYYGYHTADDNAHVLLGKIRYIQPDGSIGVGEDGAEVPGSRYFYGPAYSFNALNTLGQDAFEILVLGLIHSKTIGHSIAVTGAIRAVEKVFFGNLKNKFSNANPLAKFIGTGGVGLGQPLPTSTSLIDIIGDFTGPYDGAVQDANIKASLDLLHTDVDNVIDETQLKFGAAGTKTIAAAATKYLSIDSGTDGAEIVSITIKGVVGADWTIETYIPAADLVAAPAAADKRDEDVYVNTDDKGGQMTDIGAIRYNMFLDITNDSGAPDDITEAIVAYRSAGTLNLTWEV